MTPNELFERLEPPPGGREALRRRLAADTHRRRRRLLLAATTTSALVAAAALVLVWRGGTAPPAPSGPPQPDLIQGSAAHPALTGLDEPVSDEPVTVLAANRNRYAVRRVATRTPQVVFYMVASERHDKRD